MKGIKNENDGKKSLHGIRRNGIRRNGKTPLLDIKISVDAVKSKMNKMTEDKLPSVDDLSPRLLRSISEAIAHLVTMLFNQSMNEGDVPLDWRSASVTPIFYKGTRNQPENYGPVNINAHIAPAMKYQQQQQHQLTLLVNT